jgi:hypothetical protein
MQKNLLRCRGSDPVSRGTPTLAQGRGVGSGGRTSCVSVSSPCTTAGTLSGCHHRVTAARRRRAPRQPPTRPGTAAATPKNRSKSSTPSSSTYNKKQPIGQQTNFHHSSTETNEVCNEHIGARTGRQCVRRV